MTTTPTPMKVTLVYAEVGPTELKIGRTYVHDVALDGDEDLHVGKSVEVIDGAGWHFKAEVTDRDDGGLWQLTLDLSEDPHQ